MTPDQRAALERLLEYVGRGFCAVQADCRMLREFLASLPPVVIPCTTEEFIARCESMRWALAAHVGDLKPVPQDKDAVIASLAARLADIDAKKDERAYKRALAKQRAEKSKKKPKPKTRKR